MARKATLQDVEQKLAEAKQAGDAGLETLLASLELMTEVVPENPQEILALSRDALELAEKFGDKKAIAESLLEAGFAHYLMSDHDLARPPMRRALELFEELGDRTAIGRTKGSLAGVHLSQGAYEMAFREAHDAITIMREIGDREFEGWLLQGLATGYVDLGDYDAALRYGKESLEIMRELDYEIGVGRAMSNVGTAYQSKGDIDKAREYHEQSLAIFRKNDNKLGLSRALNDLGLVHQSLGEFDEARRCHEEALALRDEVGNKQAKSTSLINLGTLFLEQNKVDEALENLHRALTLAMEINAKPRIYQANLALSDAHEAAGDFENALAHYKIYQQVREEVLGDQAATQLRNMQIDFETLETKREAEINRLKNVELREKNDQLEELLRELKEAETQLIQQEKMAALGKLVAGVVHEMNTPLGAINSVADTVARCIVNIVDELESAESVDDLRASRKFSRAIDVLRQDSRITADAASRISRIVGSLKSFIRLDEASYQEVDIHEGLDSTITLLEHDFGARIEVVRDYGELPLVRCYPSELNQVFMNLLSNASQAIDGSGKITVRTNEQGGYVRVEFSDTGVGIPSEQLVTIFEPIISKKGSRVKAGMGLFTSYNIIQKHHGNIEVMSEVGAGTTFTVIIPVDGEAAEVSAG